MREWDLTLEDGLRTGLRKHHRNPRNSEALLRALNIKATEEGAEAFAPFSELFPQAVSDWPFPQVVEGVEYSFLITRDGIAESFKIYKIEGDYSLTFLYEAADSVFGTHGGMFEIVDYGPWFLMTNGAVMLRFDIDGDVFTVMKYNDDIPRVAHVCDFNGQIVACNVTSDWHDCDTSSIIWSEIGAADFNPTLKNTSGFRRRMPQGGVAHGVRKLGKSVIVYSAKQIAELIPVIEPAPTFGINPILGVGVAGPNTIAGDEHVHVFIDKYGWLYKMEPKKLDRLGYKEFMIAMDIENVVITHHPEENEFYISDGTTCYLLYGRDLTEVHQCPTSIAYINGEVGAIVKDTGNKEVYILYDIIDFNFRPLKSISTIEVGMDMKEGVKAEVSVFWKSKKQKNFAQTQWVPLNDQGIASLVISGTDFKIALRVSDYDGTSVDYMIVRWKMSDLRNFRGVYSPPTSLRGQRR